MLTNLVVGIGGSIFGVIGGIIQRIINNRHEQQMLILKASYNDIDNARRNTDRFFQWTRRTIIIMIAFYFYVFPIIGAFLSWNNYIAYSESNGFLKSLFYGHNDVMWRMLPPGYIVFPIQSYFAGMGFGLYFGNKK